MSKPQYILIIHNAHAGYSSASDSSFYGPFDYQTAKAKLREHVENMGDELYKLDESLEFAGYEWAELFEAKRDEDLASEVWAEIALCTEDINWFRDWAHSGPFWGSLRC